jgi:hypothetical protein
MGKWAKGIDIDIDYREVEVIISFHLRQNGLKLISKTTKQKMETVMKCLNIQQQAANYLQETTTNTHSAMMKVAAESMMDMGMPQKHQEEPRRQPRRVHFVLPPGNLFAEDEEEMEDEDKEEMEEDEEEMDSFIVSDEGMSFKVRNALDNTIAFHLGSRLNGLNDELELEDDEENDEEDSSDSSEEKISRKRTIDEIEVDEMILELRDASDSDDSEPELDDGDIELNAPVIEPSVEPIIEPIIEPSVEPIIEPSVEPIVGPSVQEAMKACASFTELMVRYPAMKKATSDQNLSVRQLNARFNYRFHTDREKRFHDKHSSAAQREINLCANLSGEKEFRLFTGRDDCVKLKVPNQHGLKTPVVYLLVNGLPPVCRVTDNDGNVHYRIMHYRNTHKEGGRNVGGIGTFYKRIGMEFGVGDLKPSETDRFSGTFVFRQGGYTKAAYKTYRGK